MRLTAGFRAVQTRVLAVLACLALPALQALAEAPRVEDYAAAPRISLVTLSAEGDRVAYRVPRAGGDRVIVKDPATMETLASVDLDLGTLQRLELLGEDSLVVFTSTVLRDILGRAIQPSGIAYRVDVDTGTAEALLDDVTRLDRRQQNRGRVAGVSSDGRRLYMPAVFRPSAARYRRLGLFEVTLETGQAHLIQTGSKHTLDWIMNGAGRPVAREDFNDQRNIHEIRAVTANQHQPTELRTLFRKQTPYPTLSIAGLSRDETALVTVSENPDTNGTDLFLIDLEDGGVRAAGLGRPNATIDRVIADLGRRVAGVSFTGLEPRYGFFDPALEARIGGIQSRFEGSAVRLVDWSDDFETLLLHLSGSTSSGEYLLDDGAPELRRIGLERPDISTPAKVRIIRYPARDGLEIPALLTLPARAEPGGPWPLMVLPHGGPRDNEELGFDAFAQYFAQRGLAVLQPQYRGSTGQGIAFEQAGQGEWGRAMSTDLDDGVRFLADEGLIDPQRVCMVGVSYGGYAALAAGAFSPSTYACLVSVAGISDLREVLRYERRKYGRRAANLDYLERQFGAGYSDRQALKARSPVFFAERFQAPVLLLHGADDKVVLPRQSKAMARALERAGKPVDLVLMEGVGHWLAEPHARQQVMEQVDAFLRDHLF